MRRHTQAPSAGSTTRGPTRTRRTLFGLACLCILGLAAFLGSGAPSAGAAEACPNEALRVGFSADLPDCRAYEMVSPPDKDGHDVNLLIVVSGFDFNPIISSLGDTVASDASGALGGEPTAGGLITDYLSRIAPSGWSSEQISPPIETGTIASGAMTFTPDLSKAVVQSGVGPPLTPGGSAGTTNLYLRDNEAGTYSLITVGAPAEEGIVEWRTFLATSADASHVTFSSPGIELTGDSAAAVSPYLYDWSAASGAVKLVGRLPDGTVSAHPVSLAAPPGNVNGARNPWHPLSEDGSHIFFETRGHGETDQVFVRINETTTQEVSESQRSPADTAHPAQFWLASADGSLAYFTSPEKLTNDATTGPSDEGEDLYRYDVGAEGLTDITPDASEEAAGGARVQGVLGASEDGSRVYFVAEGVLASGATAGEYNLYDWSEGSGIKFIATGTTSSAFTGNWSNTGSRSSRVSPDGAFLAFTADNSLTGYANEGNPEIYLYSAATGELVCASCNPSGAPATSGAAIRGFSESVNHLSRSLSADGRFVFFNTEEALLPSDVNHKEDAYQFNSETGEVSLLSTGISPQPSRFTDAALSGSDALVATRERLVGIDQDENIDVYDARVGGGFASQNPPPPAPPCTGKGCRGESSSPDLAAPASAGFVGKGNVSQRQNCNKLGREAKKLSNRAKKLRRHAKQAKRNGRSAVAKKRNKKATRLAKRARNKSKSAKRCRKANRRASK